MIEVLSFWQKRAIKHVPWLTAPSIPQYLLISNVSYSDVTGRFIASHVRELRKTSNYRANTYSCYNRNSVYEQTGHALSHWLITFVPWFIGMSWSVSSSVIPGGSDSKSVCLQCERPRFDPWVGKILWRRKWQPAPVLLPVKISWTEERCRLQSMGSQRVGHNWVTSLSLSSLRKHVKN